MIIDDNILILSLICAFLLFMGIGTIYTSHYQEIPFGMWDVDNYMCHVDSFTMTNCTKWDISFSMKRPYSTLILSGLEGHQINYIVNLLIWFILPLCFYSFSKEYMNYHANAIHTTFYFMFATFQYHAFGIMFLNSQLTGFIFFLLSLIYFMRENWKIFSILSIFSIVGHRHNLYIYIILFMCYFWYNKKYKHIFVSILIFVFLLTFADINLFKYSIFQDRPEPSLYDIFFIFTNPLLSLFFFIGLYFQDDSILKRFTLVLLFVSPFSHVARGLPLLQVFIACVGYIGLKKTMFKLGIGSYLELIFLCSIVLHFNYLTIYFFKNLVLEMPFRGLDPSFFISYFNI